MARTRLLIPVLLILPAVILPAQVVSVRPGTQMPVELRTKINTHSVKPGAKIEFRTTEAVLIGHNIVVPEDAKVTGRIEQVTEGAGTPPNSALRISVGILKWKHGEAPLNAVVVSIEPNPAQQILSTGRRKFRDPPTFLKDIKIRSHLSRNAFTEFYSERPGFTVNKGLNFLLREVDPNHDPKMMSKDHILDVGPQD